MKVSEMWSDFLREQAEKSHKNAQAEALAAEATAVFNLAEIRKLEKYIKEMDVEAIGWIEALQDASGAMRSDTVRLMQHCTELQNALADARRDTADLATRIKHLEAVVFVAGEPPTREDFGI